MRYPAAALLLTALPLLLGACATSHAPSSGPTAAAPHLSQPTAVSPQSLLFLTTSSTDSPHRAVLTFDFAVIAREKGHDVSVFLAGDATLLMKEKVRVEIRAPGQPGAAELIAKARDLGIPVYI